MLVLVLVLIDVLVSTDVVVVGAVVVSVEVDGGVVAVTAGVGRRFFVGVVVRVVGRPVARHGDR